jgi:hypothetical protein
VDGPLAYSALNALATDGCPPLQHLKRLSACSQEDEPMEDDDDDWGWENPELLPLSDETQHALAGAVKRGAFPALEELDFGFSEDGFEYFADALEEGGAESCGRSLKRVTLPIENGHLRGYRRYACLMLNGTMPNLEEIVLEKAENGGRALHYLVTALECGGGRRLRRLRVYGSVYRVQGYDHAVSLPTRLGRVLADKRLCPAIKSVGVQGYARECGFVNALKRRFRHLKTLDNSRNERIYPPPPAWAKQPDLPGVLYWEWGRYQEHF